MKKILSFFSTAIVLTTFSSLSCGRLGEESGAGTGKLQISFVDGGELFTKAYPDIPDTADFLLKITDASGRVIFDGKYGDCRETLDVSPGTYNVKVLSSEYLKPAFETPQFGDEQCVIVPHNGIGKVTLLCRQMNAGVRLVISSAFLKECEGAVLFLKSEDSRLMYSYSEKRTAYFAAGPLSLIMNDGATDKVLMVRNLNEGEMLTLNVAVARSGLDLGSGVTMQIDTSRMWTHDTCVIGGTDSGTGPADAMSVSDVKNAIGKTGVWVCGYIVGGDLTSSSASFYAPFKSRTNILLGPRSTTIDRDACVSVQLPENEVRKTVNLVDNPGLLGKRICIKGDVVEAYFGLPGIKNSSEYKIY